jgi:hypothetical protein
MCTNASGLFTAAKCRRCWPSNAAAAVEMTPTGRTTRPRTQSATSQDQPMSPVMRGFSPPPTSTPFPPRSYSSAAAKGMRAGCELARVKLQPCSRLQRGAIAIAGWLSDPVEAVGAGPEGSIRWHRCRHSAAPPEAAWRCRCTARSRTTQSPWHAGNAAKHWSADTADSVRMTALRPLFCKLRRLRASRYRNAGVAGATVHSESTTGRVAR